MVKGNNIASPQWQASWIWAQDGADHNEFRYFRKSFTLPGGIKSARVFISAESWYRLFINGAFIHRGTSVSYPGQQVYDRLEVTKYLKKGRNALAVLVNYYGIPSGWSVPKAAGLLAQLEVLDQHGRPHTVGTDNTWKTFPALEWERQVPRRSFWLNLEYIEVRDFRRELPGWTMDTFDDADWSYCYALRRAPYGEYGRLEERSIAFLQHKMIKPQALVRSGTVDDILPDLPGQYPVFHLNTRQFKNGLPAGAAYHLGCYIHTTQAGNARLVIESDTNSQAKVNGKTIVFKGKQEIKTADLKLVKGRNQVLISLDVPKKENLYFTVVPLANIPSLQFYADPAMQKSGWELTVSKTRIRVNNTKKLVEAFPPAKLQAQEEIGNTGPGRQPHSGRRLPQTFPALPRGKSYAFIYDMGREINGYPQVTVKGGSGVIVDIGEAEMMQANRIDPTYADVYYTDRFILDDRERTAEPLEWKGMRYFQVTIRNVRQKLVLKNVTFKETFYPFKPQGRFACSDPLLNKIWEVSARSAALSMMDTPMDCPWREKRQWMGDAALITLINYYAFGDYQYARHALWQQSYFQDTDGRVFVCLPLKEEYPMQSMDWLLGVWDYYVHSGDKSLLEQLLPRIMLAVNWLLQNIGPNGLYVNRQPGTYQWIDNVFSGVYHYRDTFFPLNAKLYQVLLTMGKYFSLMGKGQLAEKMKEQAEILKSAVVKKFWDRQKSLFRDLAETGSIKDLHSEISNGAALVSGIATPEMARSIIQKVFVENRRGVEASPYFKAFIYQGLIKYQRQDLVVAEIRRKWGDMLAQGATSFWEGFKKERSLCHGWGGFPAVIFSREILGVKAVEKEPGGFAEVEVKPYPGKLTWAKGEVPTRYGPVKVEWKAKNGTMTSLKVKAPRQVKILRGKPS